MTGVATAIMVAVSAATAIYSGEKAAKSARKSLRNQKQAQRQSLLSSINQEKLAAQAERKANKKKPDVSSLLFSERAQADTGVGSTILAGRGGGGVSLLGSKSTLVG